MGKGYNNYMCKKPFHPGSKANIKRAWMAEQKTENEKKKQEELKTQYEKEQDLYNNRALISSESKDKLELNFMYEAPPGAKRERQKEDDEPEYKFEWQRKYNAPREDYARGNEDIKDQPFGIPVRNVRCIKCHKWGHINTDRECPLFMQASASSMPSTSMDPMELMRQMSEDGYGLKENVLGHHINPKAANQQLIPSDESDPETEFLKSLSTAEKKKLLRKLKKLSKKQEKSKKKKSKKSKKSKSKEWSESDSEQDTKQKRKRTKHKKSSSSCSDSSSEESCEEISSNKRKDQNPSNSRDEGKRISRSKPPRETEKHSSVSDASKKHSKDEVKNLSKEKLLKKSDKHSTVSDISKKHCTDESLREKQTRNSEKPISDVSKKQKLVHDEKLIHERSNKSHAEEKVTKTEKITEDGIKKTKKRELPSSNIHLVHASSSKESNTLSSNSDVIQSNWKSSYSSSSSESEEKTKTRKVCLEVEKSTKRKTMENTSDWERAKKIIVEKADSDIKPQTAINSKPQHPDGFSHVCPQAKIESNYLLASEEYKGKMHDKFRNLYREDRSPSVKQKYNK